MCLSFKTALTTNPGAGELAYACAFNRIAVVKEDPSRMALETNNNVRESLSFKIPLTSKYSLARQSLV
jgi:hypothetical protein